MVTDEQETTVGGTPVADADSADSDAVGEATPANEPPAERDAARSVLEDTIETVLDVEYEVREIVVAQGLQFNNTYFRANAASSPGLEDFIVPDGLQRYFPSLELLGDDRAQYVSDVQHVRFAIRVVDTKTDLKDALQTSGVHVVYHGHARYGRGPCFGTDMSPGDDWEQGTDPANTGIFRMGHPIIGIPVKDIAGDDDHPGGYHCWPVAGTEELQRSDCDAVVRANWGNLRRIPLPDGLESQLLPQAQPPADSYWGYRDGEGQNLLLWAGWDGTTSAPMDLGATDLQCRCFCHFGCSTYLHNWRVVRELKAWQRTADERFAYFTTAPSPGPSVTHWLRALFSYPRRNDFESWYPSLQWARSRANQLILAWSIQNRAQHWQII